MSDPKLIPCRPRLGYSILHTENLTLTLVHNHMWLSKKKKGLGKESSLDFYLFMHLNSFVIGERSIYRMNGYREAGR